MTIYNQERIKEHIIHRNENFLLDKVETQADKPFCGKLELTIIENDPLDRDIFVKKKTDTLNTVLVPVTMEYLALGSIVCSGKLKPGEMVIFASIMKFTKEGDLPFNQPIKGYIERISDKGGFLKYSGRTFDTNNHTIAEGSMLALFTDEDKQSDPDGLKSIDTLPPLDLNTPITPYPFKHPKMCVADTLKQASDTDGVTEYTYPEDHPFIKGHFPGNPIMMGIMQWLSVEDSLLAWALHHKKTGAFKLSCNAAIVKASDKSLVTEVKGLTVQVWIDAAPYLDQSETLSLKKIIFRQMIHPGDTILTHVSDVQILAED